MKLLIVVLLSIFGLTLASPSIKPIQVGDARTFRGMRIVGGYEAGVGDIPYQVSVLAPVAEGSFVVCGGTIISDEHVLTAAHCTAGHTEFRLGFGSVRLQTAPVTIVSTRKLENPQYNALYLNNDVAIIYLPVKLSFTNLISPAALPRRSQQSDTFINERVVASGYGVEKEGGAISEKLSYVYLRPIGNAECAITFGNNVVIASTLCTRGYDFNAQSICVGDTGGPLVLDDTDSTLIGVGSFVSSRGCSAADPAGFSRVTSHLDWISTNTGVQIRP